MKNRIILLNKIVIQRDQIETYYEDQNYRTEIEKSKRQIQYIEKDKEITQLINNGIQTGEDLNTTKINEIKYNVFPETIKITHYTTENVYPYKTTTHKQYILNIQQYKNTEIYQRMSYIKYLIELNIIGKQIMPHNYTTSENELAKIYKDKYL